MFNLFVKKKQKKNHIAFKCLLQNMFWPHHKAYIFVVCNKLSQLQRVGRTLICSCIMFSNHISKGTDKIVQVHMLVYIKDICIYEYIIFSISWDEINFLM